ncbi:hypothetical protein [Marimonas arenosa]|uniref:Glycosyl transferase family 2 n=1 Tax=Marimonas arenosa TaxID=1795305 RepID=A0AAE4B5L2_9RHOB|nr:hypothetical protein [Marimonas arenosa]MDQ2091282.1 hypothetical protein [Marimonas arenosa]
MKLAFLTMVWRDYWLLGKWVHHNAKIVPKRQLYVINHGGDPEVDRLAEGCNVIHVPRDELTTDLTRRRWDLKGAMTNGLLAFHDRVVCTDVDELLVYVGDKPGGLIEHLEVAPMEGNATAPVGLNLVPRESDSAEDGLTVLERHPNALLAGKYTKPCIAHARVVYTVGGHGLQRGQFRIDPEILLFHLHYVTPDYQERMAARQGIVAQAKDHNALQENPEVIRKRHWINWSNPEHVRNKDFGNFDRAEEIDVSGGFSACADLLRGAIKRSDRQMVVDPRIINEHPRRIVVPAALRKAI